MLRCDSQFGCTVLCSSQPKQTNVSESTVVVLSLCVTLLKGETLKNVWISRVALILHFLSFFFVLMNFCFFRRFPQGCSLCGHWECRSNSKSVGVPLIWTLEDWTTTPITQALLWTPIPLPHPTSPPLPSPNLNLTRSSSCPPPAALTTMVIYPLRSLVQ